MKTYILIADINFNDRADIEAMEDMTFDTVDQVFNLIDHTPDEGYSAEEKSRSECKVIGDFCDMVNDEFYNDSSSWITYINIK